MFSRPERGVAQAEKGRERDQHQRPPRQAEGNQTAQHRVLGTGRAIDEQGAPSYDLVPGPEAPST